MKNTDDKFTALWNAQKGKCAITRLPMDMLGSGLEELVIVPVGFKHNHQKGKEQLAFKWAADARGMFEDTEIRAVLSRYKAHREDHFDHFANMRLMMDHVATLLRRAGLSPRNHCVNMLSVYNIEEPNEFEGRPVATVEFRGTIDFAGEIRYYKDSPNDYKILDLADPNYHIALLKFFGIEDYEFQIFADHDVFADL